MQNSPFTFKNLEVMFNNNMADHGGTAFSYYSSNVIFDENSIVANIF